MYITTNTCSKRVNLLFRSQPTLARVMTHSFWNPSKSSCCSDMDASMSRYDPKSPSLYSCRAASSSCTWNRRGNDVFTSTCRKCRAEQHKRTRRGGLRCEGGTAGPAKSVEGGPRGRGRLWWRWEAGRYDSNVPGCDTKRGGGGGIVYRDRRRSRSIGRPRSWAARGEDSVRRARLMRSGTDHDSRR